MNLPPSIVAILETYPPSFYEEEVIHAVAHEACRLQREADRDMDPITMARMPLVVPSL